jgi:hypothetical protein
MNSLEADIEIGADGSMKLLSPLPSWLRPGRAHVVLTLTSGEASGTQSKRRKLTATAEMVAKRIAAFEELRALGGLRDVIPDPVAWQREMREDRPLPGR